MKKESRLLMILVIVSFIFISSLASASLGLTPAKINMNFVPGFEKELEPTIECIAGGNAG